jgi:hypothetical protein
VTADRIVFVRWIDSNGPSGWHHDPVDNEPSRCRSIGWLLAESDEAITIASHLDGDPIKSRDGEFTIPRCSIVEMIDVELPKVDSK